jgi:hypothetical protein
MIPSLLRITATAKAGVMMALPGSVQGTTGFYFNPASNSVFYYRINEQSGAWDMLFDDITQQEWRDLLKSIKDSKGVVAAPGTVDGKIGWYFNQKIRAVYMEPDENGTMIICRNVGHNGGGGGGNDSTNEKLADGKSRTSMVSFKEE